MLLTTILLISLLNPNCAKAQFLLDQFMSESAGAKNETQALNHKSPSTDEIIGSLQKQGYSDITVSTNNPQQFVATSPIGMHVLLTVEPMTGKIISVTPQ